MGYKLLPDSDSVLRSDGAFVPADPLNSDWQEYQNWVAEGNVPEPADPPTPAPISVTPWQIRKALNAMGLRSAVEAAVASADIATQDGWQYATEFLRTDALVVSFSLSLGKSESELDALFTLAATL